MNSLLQRYHHFFVKPQTLLLLAVPLGILAGWVMPGAEADLRAHSGGVGPLDLLFFYTPETAFQHLDAYGEQGRSLYLACELSADVVYPVFYTLFFLTLALWLMKKNGRNPSPLSCLPPLLPFFFDLLENTMVAALLLIYPQKPGWVALLAGVFTLCKWLAVAGVLSQLGVLSLQWALNRQRAVQTD